MKRLELQKHKFDGGLRLAFFFGLIIFAIVLHLTKSGLVNEVVAAILVLAGTGKGLK